METFVSLPKTIFIFIFLTIILCFQANHIEAQTVGLGQLLPIEEVDALKEIGVQLGKKDWNFSLNPCDGNSNWNTSKMDDMPNYNNSITCDCSSFSAGVCHVTQLFLKGQDLDGVLPHSLAKLPFLTEIDLSRNYLSGTIPPEWTLLSNLKYMSVMVNRLSGPIPGYLGNMTNLTYMSLENNMFNGTIPAALGNMSSLETLILKTNNLTGQIPTELSKLTKLRLSSNNFTGKLILFDSWTNLQTLEIQGSGFEGPIPSNISLFKNLTELKISDLKGSAASAFPSLSNMTSMNNLMLRSCNLSGSISDDIAQMESLSYLDLSFNNLVGEVPNLQSLKELEIMYLTGNSLSGSVPDWIKNKDAKYQIDLSYNNFTEISQPLTCGDTLNFYRSFGMKNHSKLSTCLHACSKDYYEVHINCGGKGTKVGNFFFEADENSASGNANFYMPTEYWGSSNTGNFRSSKRSVADYTAKNISVLNVNDSALYTTARLSALSLAYYGRCLANGNYTVTLHFAEIIFRDNRSFQSLGKRMFDVYIQDERKLQDFNIESAAGGVDKATTQQFKAIVTDRVLEIRFQFAGKGSTAVPNQATYGPLISAISIKSDFKPPSHIKRKIKIAVSSAASAVFVILIVCITAWKFYSKNKISREQELRGLDLRTGVFTYKQIRAATDDFNTANKIGEGGFGSVYKGTLLDGKLIAVKRLSQKSKQGNREFVNEIGMISGLEHPNVVKLYGCCIEGNQLLLVYEYLENNNLAQALFGRKEMQLDLNWQTRQSICVGIAKGLSFLHDESALKIVHRDIKGNNILLDGDLNPKISDFGLAKLDEQDNTHITTRVAGTLGYMAPEYALWGYLTYKADVYSFGIVALEIVAGKNNMLYRPSDDYVCLLDWALVLQKRGILVELVDKKLGKNYDIEEAIRVIRIALLCTNPSPALRPKMSDVVSMLEGQMSMHEFISALTLSKHNERQNHQISTDKYEEIMQMTSNSSDTEPLVYSSSGIDSSTFSITT